MYTFNMEYKKRVIDEVIHEKLKTFGAILIEGPKGCGKTTTGKHFSNSFIELEDENKAKEYQQMASISYNLFLDGDKPRLIDEWQDIPEIFSTIRLDLDDSNLKGQYILTGSTSKKVNLKHTGTLRISRTNMFPLSLYETNESNGTISITYLFDNPQVEISCKSDLSLSELEFLICRGGWPTCLDFLHDENSLLIAKVLYHQVIYSDVNSFDKSKKNTKLIESILRSYSRNVCTLATDQTILKDCNGETNVTINTMLSYIDALKSLFIIDNIESFSPPIRCRDSIRQSSKKNLIDPSIATAALGISPKYFFQNKDFLTLGFLFECLCIRDLKVYSSILNGKVLYYRDKSGLEADCVLKLEDNRYALIEFKLGSNQLDEGAYHLNKIESLINAKIDNDRSTILTPPTLKIIITATEYGYRRKDGVYVIPIGCIKD